MSSTAARALVRPAVVGTAAFVISGPVGGAANFLFHAIAARALGPSSYGALTALLALTVAVAVPAAAVQMTLARSLISGVASSRDMLRSACRVAAWLSVVTLALAPLVSDVLELGSIAPVVALVGYLAATIVGLVPKAVLVSEERLGALGAGTLLGVATRLGIGALWLAWGGGLTAAVLAGSIAETVATVALLGATRLRPGAGRARQSWRAHLGPVMAFGSLWVFLAVDTLAARILFEPAVAGSYSASSVLARAVLFIPQTVATAAFARLADPVTRARALAWSTSGALTIAVAGVTGLALLGPAAFALLFGAEYALDARVLILLATGAAVMAVVNVWIHARVAYGQGAGFRMLGAVLVAGAGAAVVGGAGPIWLAWWMLAAALLCLWLVRPRSAVAAPFPDTTRMPPATTSVDVSLVLPAYQVAGSIGPHLLAVERALAGAGTYEVIVVDDGSTDATVAAAEAAAGPHTSVILMPHRGKGAAISTGMSRARGRLVGFIDADGDVPASALTELIDAVNAGSVDGAVAIKARTGSRGVHRLVLSLGYRWLARIALAVGVSDTQTGAKLFRRDVVAAVLPWTSENGFTWDAEFLAAAKRMGFARFAEVPVSVGRSSSSVTPRAVWDALRCTIRIGARVAMLPSFEGPVATGSDALGAVVRPRPAPVTTDVEPLRILVLNWKCLRHPRAGGAELYTHEVVRRWAASGHRVTMFAPAVAGAPAYEEIDGYRVVRDGSRLSVYRQARRFWFAHRDEFDVIVDEVNTRPFDAPMWSDVPVVAVFHQLARDVWFHEVPPVVAAAGRYVLEPTWLRSYRDVIVATISESSVASLRHAGLERVVNVGVGIDRPDLIPDVPKATEPTVAFLGRMVSAKRPLDAIRAFEIARQRLGRGHMYLMGDGPIAGAVERAAASTEGVEYLGRVDEDRKLHILARSHAIVVTSVREGWGLVVDEAAAAGAHPIGYRVPGLVDSIPAAGGTVVDPNPDALGAALVDLLPALAAQPSPRRGGGACSWDEVAQRLMGVVTSTLATHDRGGVLR